MKLLIVTQAVDINNPILGFFHRWIEEFSKNCEKVTVIALGVGEYKLPQNVNILSLGKNELEIGNWELGIIKKLIYIINFYRYIWQYRSDYDTVFVHMNQEYVILGWLLWKLMAKTLNDKRSPVPQSGIRGKKIMLWRNHPMGNFFTNIAVWVSDRVFCTSQYSYTAKFKKTEIMPVGIDTTLFKRNLEIKKIPNSILFLGRISPIKNIHILIKALDLLNKEKIDFNTLIVGDVVPKDREYYEGVKNKIREYGLESKIKFSGGVKNSETIDLYNKYEIFVNLTPTGSMDKTIFEAMACESLVAISNKSLQGKISDKLIFQENNFKELAVKLKEVLGLSVIEKEELGKDLRNYILKEHGLALLIGKICK